MLLLLGLLTVLYHRLQFAVTLWPIAGIVIGLIGNSLWLQVLGFVDKPGIVAGLLPAGLTLVWQHAAEGWAQDFVFGRGNSALLSGSPVMLGRRGREEFEAGRAAVRAAAARGRATIEPPPMPAPRPEAGDNVEPAPASRTDDAEVESLRALLAEVHELAELSQARIAELEAQLTAAHSSRGSFQRRARITGRAEDAAPAHASRRAPRRHRGTAPDAERGQPQTQCGLRVARPCQGAGAMRRAR